MPIECDKHGIKPESLLSVLSPWSPSDANNPGTVTLRVIDDKGKQVGSTKTVSPGKDVVLDQIPALSGTYTIQWKASVAGTYTFNVD